MTKRRSFSDKFVATVALEALRGDKMAQEITAKDKTDSTQLTTWTRQAVDSLMDGFKAKRVTNDWIGFYNSEWPHAALDMRSSDAASFDTERPQRAAWHQSDCFLTES